MRSRGVRASESLSYEGTLKESKGVGRGSMFIQRKPFRQAFSLEKRRDVSGKIRKQYPDRIPVIVERVKDSDAPLIEKEKYLVPSDITIGRLIFEVRMHLRVTSERAIFLYVNDSVLPSTQTLVSALYEVHKNEDGFLYVQYTGENTFG